MTECTKCKWVDGTLFDALESIVWYDGHYEWLKDLRDTLTNYPDDNVFLIPKETEWHSEKHTIMMLLVGMFGDWGTSIRCGWIKDRTGCIEFINRLCEDCWERGDNE